MMKPLFNVDVLSMSMSGLISIYNSKNSSRARPEEGNTRSIWGWEIAPVGNFRAVVSGKQHRGRGGPLVCSFRKTRKRSRKEKER